MSSLYMAGALGYQLLDKSFSPKRMNKKDLRQTLKSENFPQTLESPTESKHKFQARLDVQHFKKQEIVVKALDDKMVIVEAKHDEREDDHGFVSRHFVRKYKLPMDCEISKIQCRLSSDGVLTIYIPETDYTTIPILDTGIPAKKSDIL